jgi:predicted phage terminase large subunit-like protein
MLVKGWRKHLELHGLITERKKDETTRSWLRRAQPEWGLVEWVAETCRFRNADGVVIGTVDRLLIEAKASGITVAQEIQRLYGDEGWITELDDPHGDKVARAHSVVPIFANAQVYAPDREWADVVIDEMATFPHGRYDDLTDTATQALRHLRAGGMLQQKSEIAAEDDRRSRLKSRKGALYPA